MRAIVKFVACAIVVASCAGCEGRKNDTKQESTGDVAPAQAAPALAVTEASWSPESIDELVAPIALYPDQLVGQILAASVNTQEVLDAGNWLLQNQNLKGDQLDAAAQKAGFGPATRALVQFPTVVDMMCQELDWTRQLGAAFTSDQKAVLDAIQRLRKQAADVGNLKSTPQQTVEHKEEDGKEIVEVKPANPEVVYVPQYDPTIIYTTPPAPAPAPAPAPQPAPNTVSTESAIAGGLLAFGVGILVGSAISNNNSYCYPAWGPGAVYYGPRPFYPPAYVYRPVYGPAFRPAYGYRPPMSYPYRYNGSNNIVINNNNYYNRFNKQNNIRVNNVNNSRNAVGNRVGQSGPAGRGDNFRGQSSYAGARPGGATNDRRGGATNNRATPNNRGPTTNDRRTTPQRGNQSVAQRSAQPTSRAAQQPNDGRDRGYGNDSPTSARKNDTPAKPQATPNVSRDQPRSEPDRALSGASKAGSGSFDRAASARGHASASASRDKPARGRR